jgi:hypothetical protein
MNLNRRIDALEKATDTEPRALHVVTAGSDETSEEATTRYCLANNFEEGKFINGELGNYPNSLRLSITQILPAPYLS